MGRSFARLNRRANRCPLAVFDHKEIAHLGALKTRAICGEQQNRRCNSRESRDFAILVHPGGEKTENTLKSYARIALPVPILILGRSDGLALASHTLQSPPKPNLGRLHLYPGLCP